MTQQNSIIEALSSAQKIAFSPFVFQATVAAKRLGILQCLAEHPTGLTVDEIADATHLTPYAVQVVTELLTAADVTAVTEDRLTLTKTGDCLLLDTMTSVNLDFTADVCYRGLDHLQEALTTGTAAGLKELGNWTDTIYPHLFELSPRAKASWFGFDHFYSDGAFRDCARWLKKNVAPKRLFDVGGNTGKFAGVALREMPDLCVKIIDLPQQCRLAEENSDLADVRQLAQSRSAPRNGRKSRLNLDEPISGLLHPGSGRKYSDAHESISSPRRPHCRFGMPVGSTVL